MEKLQTPFYRVKEKDLLYDINLLKEALTKNWGNFIMGYSVKTNSLPWLLVYLKRIPLRLYKHFRRMPL